MAARVAKLNAARLAKQSSTGIYQLLLTLHQALSQSLHMMMTLLKSAKTAMVIVMLERRRYRRYLMKPCPDIFVAWWWCYWWKASVTKDAIRGCNLWGCINHWVQRTHSMKVSWWVLQQRRIQVRKVRAILIYHDKEINHKAAAWVREHAFQKRSSKYDCLCLLCVGQQWSANSVSSPPTISQVDLCQHHYLTSRVQTKDP